MAFLERMFDVFFYILKLNFKKLLISKNYFTISLHTILVFYIFTISPKNSYFLPGGDKKENL